MVRVVTVVRSKQVVSGGQQNLFNEHCAKPNFVRILRNGSSYVFEIISGASRQRILVIPTSSTTKTDNRLLSHEKVDHCLREERVWRLTYVQLWTWLFFAFYLAIRGFIPASIICFVEVIALFPIANLKNTALSKSYTLVMNASLVVSGSGVILVALTDSTLHGAMFFFPACILISSQLLGVRSAFFWLLTTLTAHTIFFIAVVGVSDLWYHKTDELMVAFGSAALFFFCCQQGEAFYLERTKKLTLFSEKLTRKSQELHELATTDSLTGLVNRLQFESDLESAVAHSVSSGEPMALFVIDMDGFKEVNDTLGHPVGDASLVEIATRLRALHDRPSIVSRLAGDEFCVIIPATQDTEAAGNAALATCAALSRRYVLGQHDFALSASVGVALCPKDSQNPTDLFVFADSAMFHAKEQELGHAFYEPTMTDELLEYRSLQEKLAFALENDEFFLTYQPQVCLETGNVFGAEALLRWNCDGTTIMPEQFIPMLEKSREIVKVGKWVIRESCRQLQQWEERGFHTKLSVNVSPVQFLDEDFCGSVERSLDRFAIDAKNLDFEITESLLIEDVKQATEKLTQLKKLGASISLDDFGTGYSSLSYLRQFSLDRLKIDRAFVKDVPDADDGVIASSIIALGKAVGLKVLAEGVETNEQLEFLKSLDCDEFQGYLSSQPLSANDFESFVFNETAATESPAVTEV